MTSTYRTQETPQDRQKLGQEVLSYGLKHSVTPKHIPTDDNVSSVESVLARQRELPESTKDDIRSSLTKRLQLDERRITRIEMAKKRQGRSHTSRGQRTCYCCYGQEGLYRQNGLTS